MGFLNAVALTAPTGFWYSIIFGLESAVLDYALALVLITIIIKLVMVPLDFINRYASKKSSRKQKEMQPELDVVNKKYANDKNMLNKKTMEIYKSHNFNIMGTCLGMVAYLAVTMVVFWTLFGALNNISAYKIGDQFLQVRQEYFASYDIDVNTLNDETQVLDVLNTKIDALGSDEAKEAALNNAKLKAQEKYEEVETGFLWIKNIWLADTTVNPVMKYKDFINKSKITEEQISEAEYDLVMSSVSETSREDNGYFILAILAAGTSYLSMSLNNWISKARAKKKGVDTALMSNNSNKIMSIVMPVIMGVFTLFYNAAFGLYIVAGALVTLVTSPLVTLFVDMLEFDAIHKDKNKHVAIYDRKRK